MLVLRVFRFLVYGVGLLSCPLALNAQDCLGLSPDQTPVNWGLELGTRVMATESACGQTQMLPAGLGFSPG